MQRFIIGVTSIYMYIYTPKEIYRHLPSAPVRARTNSALTAMSFMTPTSTILFHILRDPFMFSPRVNRWINA